MNVHAKLYDLLKENETGLYTKDFQKDKTVYAYVHIDFSDLRDFAEILSPNWFDDGGLDVQMFERTICVELNDIIEGMGHNLSSYRSCFNESDWEHYKDRIAEMEADS